jgi:serine/threonine-protein kinase
VAGIHRKRVGKASGEELLSDTPSTPTDWSGVNSHVAYTRSQGVAGSTDVWALPLLGEQKPFPLAQTRYGEQNAVFSPDGRWLAYEITAGGHTDIHLQPFPPTGGTFQISRNGGARPRWRGDSKELFFLTGTDMMQAAVDPTGRLPPGVPTRLFSVATRRTNRAGPQYGVTRDGRRFLVNAVQQELLTLPLTVLVNWRAAAQK